MSGITGLLSAKHDAGFPAVAERMGAAIAHRGPDRSGVWCDLEAGAALCHRRLAVTDLTPRGDQPMISADGRWVMSFDGAIYNHKELRATLAGSRKVDAWKGRSDAEVFMEAVAAGGLDAALERVEGQFAFALWDRASRTLHLARDRFGEKPLYWGWAGTDFVFGSELRALRRHPAFEAELDRAALGDFLRYGYVPAPASIYRHAFKLKPGFRLTIDPEDLAKRKPRLTAYWKLEDAVEAARANPLVGHENEALEEFETLLKRVVRSRMTSDAPLGVLLSGGSDSSVLAALMQGQSDRPIKTFTVGTWDKRPSEADHAKTVARALGTEHLELYIGRNEAMEAVPGLAGVWDEPFADVRQVTTLLTSRLASQQVTAVVRGDGADELFGGHGRYRWGADLWNGMRALPGPLRTVGAKALKTLSPDRWNALATGFGRMTPRLIRPGPAGVNAHRLARALELGAGEESAYQRLLLSLWDRPSILLDAWAAAGDGVAESPPKLKDASFAEQAMLFDTALLLPDRDLTRVDRAGMSMGLETRAPFLDREVLQFAWRMPSALRSDKYLLRRLLGRHAPQPVGRLRPGLRVPLAGWLRSGLRDWGEELLSERRLAQQGLFEPGAVRRLWYEHQSGRRNWDRRLWALLMFQAWDAVEAQTVAEPQPAPAQVRFAPDPEQAITRDDRRQRS